MKRVWTDEQVETLRKLWADGLSASQVAGELGTGITRNAVIGKVTRLGISERATFRRAAHRSIGAVRRPAPKKPATPILPTRHLAPAIALPIPEPVALPESRNIGLLELSETTCKFSTGRGDDGFLFCGAEKPAGCGPFCRAHARIAYAGGVR